MSVFPVLRQSGPVTVVVDFISSLLTGHPFVNEGAKKATNNAMSDLLLQPPLSAASHDEAGPSGQEQDAAMWGSIALAALDDDDDDFDVHNDDKDEKKDDDGADDGGVVLTASSSDIGSVQSRAKDGHDSNASVDDGGGNAFGEYHYRR